MKDKSVSDGKKRSTLKPKILLGALALAVILGPGTAAQAALKDTDNEPDLLLLYRQTALFNPFTLTTSSTTDIVSENSASPVTFSGGGKSKRPAIRIPFRPILRSPCQPP